MKVFRRAAPPTAAVSTGATLVRDQELEAWYDKVRSFEARDAKRARRGRDLLFITALIEGAVIVGLTYSLAAVTPAVRVVPTFIWTRPDGTVDAQIAMSVLPP